MADTSPVAVPGLTQLKADAAAYRERLLQLQPAEIFAPQPVEDGGPPVELTTDQKLDALFAWFRAELAFSVVPFHEQAVAALEQDVIAEVVDLGEQVDSLMEQAGDMISPDTADQLVGALEAGRAVANLLEKLVKHADQVTRQKATQLIRTFRGLATASQDLIEAITVDDEDEPDQPPVSAGGEDPASDEAGDDQPAEPAGGE